MILRERTIKLRWKRSRRSRFDAYVNENAIAASEQRYSGGFALDVRVAVKNNTRMASTPAFDTIRLNYTLDGTTWNKEEHANIETHKATALGISASNMPMVSYQHMGSIYRFEMP